MCSVQVIYQPDFRQDIANSWPESIDDNAARAEWGWAHSHDLPAMTQHMISAILAKEAEQQRPEQDESTKVAVPAF